MKISKGAELSLYMHPASAWSKPGDPPDPPTREFGPYECIQVCKNILWVVERGEHGIQPLHFATAINGGELWEIAGLPGEVYGSFSIDAPRKKKSEE